MRFVWNPPSLQTICQSQAALQRQWPTCWREVQMLIGYTSSALTVEELRSFHALAVTRQQPQLSNHECGLSIRYKEIEMSTTLLTAEGKNLVLRPIDESFETISSVGDLRVDGFSEQRRFAHRAAS